MRQALGWRRLVGIAAVVVGWSGLSAAEPSAAMPPETVSVDYRAPLACPADAVMTRAVLDRAPQARLAPAALARRNFEITITSTPAGYAGTLVVRDRRETSGRQLRAPRCDDLVRALALVAALTIDRDRAPGMRRSDAVVRGEPAVSVSGWAARGIGGGGVGSGIGPGPMWIAGLGVQAARGAGGVLELSGLVGSDRQTLETGSARFRWMAARASACWSASAARVETGVCLHLEGGRLLASGEGIVNARDVARPWFAGGGHIDLRWPVDSEFFGQIQLGLSAPFLRDRFYFSPNVEVHEPSAIAPLAAAGLGYRFW